MTQEHIQRCGPAVGISNGLQERNCRRTIVRTIVLKKQEELMQRTVASLILICALVLSAAPAFAHHAFATEFDAQKPVTMKGIVTKIDWVNPHVWFYINVKNDNGTIENAGFEKGGPNRLRASGWTKETMKIGDEVIVEGSLAKNGSRNVNAKNVTMASTGKKLLAASSQGGPVE